MGDLTKIANNVFGIPGNGGPTIRLDSFGGNELSITAAPASEPGIKPIVP